MWQFHDWVRKRAWNIKRTWWNQESVTLGRQELAELVLVAVQVQRWLDLLHQSALGARTLLPQWHAAVQQSIHPLLPIRLRSVWYSAHSVVLAKHLHSELRAWQVRVVAYRNLPEREVVLPSRVHHFVQPCLQRLPTSKLSPQLLQTGGARQPQRSQTLIPSCRLHMIWY